MATTLTVPRKVLLYLGISEGFGLMNIIAQNQTHLFTEIHIFEANPEFMSDLKQKFERFAGIIINHGAVVDSKPESGTVAFNISSNKGGSSSLGNFDPKWGANISMTKQYQVPAIYLPDYCRDHNIDIIDTYISDLQGADCMVLKTMLPFIRERKINRIQCEVTKNKKHNIYMDLPSNELSTFLGFLEPYYQLSSMAWVCGLLSPGIYDNVGVEKDWWEFDALFTRKITEEEQNNI